jgi:hypothetical protein
MAFVYRSARNLNAAPSTQATPPTLGPGVYPVATSSLSKSRPSLAPFSSSSDRGIDENLFESKYPSPGPGEYIANKQVQPSNTLNAANTSFVSRVPRFLSPVPDSSLGPGHYLGLGSSLNVKKKKKIKKSSNQRKSSRSHSVSPVRSSAPSIPARHQSYGYEENSDGSLVALQPPESDFPSSLVNQPTSSIDTTKGVYWAKSKSNRFKSDKEKELLPGPGQFNPKVLETRHISVFLDQKPGSAFLSLTKRVTENGLNLTGIAKDTPGPGTYPIPPSRFDQIMRVKHSIPPNFQFFGSKSERQLANYIPNTCGSNASDTAPGPGAHFNPKLASSIKVVDPTPSAPRAPFSMTGQRFSPNKQDDSGPGLIYSQLIDYSAELKKKTAGRNSTFGVTSTRFRVKSAEGRVSDTSFDALGQPIVKFNEPPHYYHQEKTQSYLDRKPTSSFLYGGSRFLVKKFDDEPVSAAEIVPKSSINTNIYASAPCSHSSSFANGDPRFKPVPGSFSSTVDCPVGPGQYDPMIAFQKVKSHGRVRDRPTGIPSASMGSSKRVDFTTRGVSLNTPGPGVYDVPPPEYLKRSFNITIPT